MTEAQARTRELAAVNGFVEHMLSNADPELGGSPDMPLRDVLDGAERTLDGFAAQPRTAGQVALLLGRTLVRWPGDLPAVRRILGRYALGRAGAPLQPSLVLDRRPAVPRPRVPKGLAFFDALGAVLAADPPPKRDRAALRRFARLGVGPCEPLSDQRDHQIVGDETPAIVDRLHPSAKLGPVFHGGSEHVAGGDVRDAVLRFDPLRLSSLPRPLGTEQEDVYFKNPS